MKKPILGITMGDPSGIGPEIILNAFTNKKIYKYSNSIIIGSYKQLVTENNNTDLKIRKITNVNSADFQVNVLNVIDLDNVIVDIEKKGKILAESGKAAFEYIQKSIELALSGEIDSVVTAPIHKEAIKAANLDFIGHTEMFGELTGSDDPLTVFEVENLRIFFLSRHVSLRQSCEMVKKDRIVKYVKRSIESLKTLGYKSGKFAVAGLNPHSSDNGLFGHEDLEEIVPAVEQLQSEGYDVIGPIGADSVFHMAMVNNWNGVLSLYHDQGHIASKTYNFDKTISLTLGLPFLRTSVDHGTAFDIAGKGIAQSISMEEAILKAAKYSAAFKK